VPPKEDERGARARASLVGFLGNVDPAEEADRRLRHLTRSTTQE
jgi:hypothetical protein